MKLYTSKVVAQWLGLTERRIRQLRDEGIISEAAPGLYDLQQSVYRYIKYIGGSGNESYQAERTRLTAEKRKAAEMENEMRQGNLHATEDIERGIKAMCLNIRNRMLVLPAKLSPVLANMGGNQAEIFDTIQAAINEALEEMSGYNAAMAVSESQAAAGESDEQ